MTQSFNTATSMGRLTLHMLPSFAQFEREVTAERIRDKVAASKRKGLWMGGRVPLGYEKDERTLRINEAEAETVRTLYALYRKHGTLRQVKAEADRLGLRTKQRFAADGTRTGGLPFRRGHLHCLGHTSHEGQAGPGCPDHGRGCGRRFQRVLYGEGLRRGLPPLSRTILGEEVRAGRH